MGATARLLAAIGLNNEQFKAGLASSRKETSGLKQDFSALKSAIGAAFTAGAVMAFVGKLKAYVDKMKDLADQTGASTESIQALTAAGINNAASQDKLTSGLQKIRAAQIAALDGNKQMRDAFERLGISMQQIEGVGADRVFELIGKSIVSAENQTTALGAASDILGTKLITNLVPALKSVGTDGLDPTIAKYKKLGVVMDEITAVKIKQMSDRWELFKVSMWVASSKVWNAIERLEVGIATALSRDPLNDFVRGMKEWGIIQEEESQKAVEAMKAANSQIVDSEQKKWTVVYDGIHRLTKEQELEAKNKADAEIAESKRSADEQKRQLDSLRSAYDTYIKASINSRFDSLSAEQQLQEQEQKRLGLIAAIKTMESDYGVEAAQRMSEYFILNTELLRVTGDVELRTRDLGQTRENEDANAKKFTAEQVEALGGLQKLLKTMSDQELADFIKTINKLHGAIGKLDFSGLLGLNSLRGFKIPNASIQNADQFGRALQSMTNAMAGLNLPNLQPLEVLKGFKIPNESVMNARNFGKAIAEMIKALNQQQINLGPLQTVADLFTALKGGTIQLQIAAPTRADLTLSMPAGMETRLTSIDGHLSTLAGMKGVLFK